MEQLKYEFKGKPGGARAVCPHVLVGVVGSGNLEVLMEPKALDGKCRFEVSTAAKGFGKIWQVVLSDFVERSGAGDLLVSINDFAASPSVVSLRLDQAFETLTTPDTRATGNVQHSTSNIQRPTRKS